ncbi:MAG: polyisoprenoid-binding protein, partial [Reyranella sp.]|nr:polyisoprenoid-binding protein [Reyranella sp.]
MSRRLRAIALAVAIGATGLAVAEAQTLPPGVFAAERDIALATAGSYTLDESHTAVIARVSHLG